MQKESSNTKTDDNFRLPKNILMIAAIVAIGVAAGFTIASTHNTGSVQANAMTGQESPQTPEHPERPDLKEELESAKEEAAKKETATNESEEESKEESKEDEKTERNDQERHQAMPAPNQQQAFAPGQAPAPGSNDQTTQIILFSVEAIAAALLVIYLIMSGFNKKSFKETLSSSDKALVFILGSLVFAAAFVGADILIANAINPRPEQAQLQGQPMPMQIPQNQPQIRQPRSNQQHPPKTKQN